MLPMRASSEIESVHSADTRTRPAGFSRSIVRSWCRAGCKHVGGRPPEYSHDFHLFQHLVLLPQRGIPPPHSALFDEVPTRRHVLCNFFQPSVVQTWWKLRGRLSSAPCASFHPSTAPVMQALSRRSAPTTHPKAEPFGEPCRGRRWEIKARESCTSLSVRPSNITFRSWELIRGLSRQRAFALRHFRRR